MKCFLMGFAGAVLGLLLSMFLGAQYANYMAGEQTTAWLSDVGPVVKLVTRNIERLHSVSGSGTGVAAPLFSAKSPPPAISVVTADGAILLQGGYKGQAVLLVPAWDGTKASWSCIGGATHDSQPCASWHAPGL